MSNWLLNAYGENAVQAIPATPSAISLSPSSVNIPDNTSVGSTIATIVVATSDGTDFTGTLGFDIPYSDDSGTFTISGTSIILAKPLPTGGSTQNITITATQNGTTISQNEAITVSDHTAVVTNIGSFTITDTLGSAQTNMPFELGFPLPIDATKLNANERIVLYDGLTQLTTQEDNRTTDRNGVIRWLKLGGILPSLSAGEIKTITVAKQVGTPNTTPHITIDQLVATDYEVKVQITFLDGTVYTAKATNALQGASTWSSNSPHYKGRFRKGQAFVEFICSDPLRKTDGTVHSHLRAHFNVAAQKDGKVRTDVIIENGYCDVLNPADQAYDLKIYVGKSSPVLVEDWPTQTIDAQISGLSTGLNGQTTITLTGGTFRFDASKDIGRAIQNTTGAGHATVVQVNSATQAIAITPNWTGSGFASATMAANTCVAYGVNHWYGAKYLRRVWWNGSGETYVFAWPAYWAQDCQMVPNFRRPSNQITYNNIANDVDKVGDRPCRRYNSNGTSVVPHVFGQTGGYPTIAVIHDMYRKYILDPSTNSRKYMNAIRNVAYTTTINYRDENTGNIPSILDRYDFSTDTRWGKCIQYPTISGNGNKTTDAPWTVDTAHHGSFYYVPYLAYGEYQDLESLGMTVMWDVGSIISANYGSNATASDPLQRTNLFFNETIIGAQGVQLRAMAWGTRIMAQASAVWPDTFEGTVLRHDRSHYHAWITNWWSRYKNNTVDDATSPGTGLHWNSELRPILWQWNGTDGGYNWPQWQQNFLMQSLNHARELGLGDANLTAILDWFDPHVLNQSLKDGTDYWWAWMQSGNDGALWPYLTSPPTTTNPGTSAPYTPTPNTWNTLWQHTKDTGSQNVANIRMNLRIDLSATSGTSASPIICTISMIDGSTGPGLFANGGSWYVGGSVHATTSGTNGPAGTGRIVEVVDANTVKLATDGIGCSAFTNTSFIAAGNGGSPGVQVWLPIPHVSDIAAYKTYVTVKSVNPYYGPAVSRASIVYAVDRGVTNARAALNHIETEMDWIAGASWPYADDSKSSEQFQIEVR